ncbi:DNA-3-methyladenine glycosylase family protein [Heyndrickxia acidicola]|uniref:DNA-3-methyladenine glycosylase II n=1 Tax=Heyndrickxia acidicola TaxID=209389 RepID=A0ABU6MHN4_9BACI|nr:DNA-3-methyladenine glycosylase [Heyndrickxia acidicola]MED1202772.1 DNA-3-methyladenine glycosylase [Heyndrickxia acidicola]
MIWIDYPSYMEIVPPKEFNFEECLVFLGRSDKEILHQIKDGSLFKLLKVRGELIVCKIGCENGFIKIEFPISPPPVALREEIAAYIGEWFDLSQELGEFYMTAGNDKLMQKLASTYYGLRMICIPDLFEAITWAIMGQQINLSFAYTLRERFVKHFGESLIFNGETYWLYPEYEKIAALDVEDLTTLQFTARKAEYIIGVAKAMTNGELSKEKLLQNREYQQVKHSLMALRGIGAWTADYVMMKCLHIPTAFPLADVGLHNALKLQLGLERKPTIDEIKELSANWAGWEAYATFYLWRSLYE